MKALLIAVLSIVAVSAQAADYDLVYMTKSGTKVEAVPAILAASKGEVIYKCQTVQASVSKSGTSVSLKNIKKPKIIKDGEKYQLEKGAVNAN